MPLRKSRSSAPWQAAAVVAGMLAALGAAWFALRVAVVTLRRALRLARFGFRVVTLTLYRPCRDCHQWLHADARVCHRCGYRIDPRPAGRGSASAPRALSRP